MSRAHERGFWVGEVLIAVAIALFVGFALFGVVRSLSHASSRSAATSGGTISLEALGDSMRSDAATAFAVFVPASDVFGAPNSGPVHEVDFYSKGDAGLPVFWAYYWDQRAQTLRRYDYDLQNHRGLALRGSGTIDSQAQYPALPGVSAFSAHVMEASDLVGGANTYGSVVAPLFANATPKPLPVGFDDGGALRKDLYGGNTIVEVQLATERGSRTLHFDSGALPTGFTVHAFPKLRAIVYRIDQTRPGVPLTQRSYVWIKARLLVSYDDFATSQIWCEYDIFGYPKGLIQPFRNTVDRYHPEWFPETTAGIVYSVTHGNTPGAVCPQSAPRNGEVTDARAIGGPGP